MAFSNGVCNKYVSVPLALYGDIDTRDSMYYASALVETSAFLTRAKHRNLPHLVFTRVFRGFTGFCRCGVSLFEARVVEDSRSSSRDRVTRRCRKSQISAFQHLPCEIILRVTHSRILLHFFTLCAYFCIIFINISQKS